MSASIRVRLGTRGSQLARWQAQWVADRLAQWGAEVELVPIVTTGDRHAEGTIGALGDRGVFTKEIQRALLEGRVDLAVHSLKDVPTDPVPGLVLAAVSERAPVADVLISPRWPSLEAVPKGGIMGTGSLRRRAQLLAVRPDLQIRDLRGNVDTRLRKVNEGQYDAVVLAQAGLRRLGLEAHITQVLPPAVVLPAVGQGALGLETRHEDKGLQELVGRLDHAPTRASVMAERAMLAALGGGCLTPIAAWGRVEDGALVLVGRVLAPDGSERIEVELAGRADTAEDLGRQVAQQLLARGAARLLAASRAAR